jgi:O-acetyl-ADP-ribose deacetylase (regulator of RNase III)
MINDKHGTRRLPDSARNPEHIVDNNLISISVNQVKLSITKGDITQQTTDAIVNAANSSLMGGSGVDGAIHRTGGPAILADCKQIISRQGRLSTGEAVITTAGNLTAKYVIHTVGPVWHGGSKGEAESLASAYRQSLNLAAEQKMASISFPSISTGAYGYPVDKAARVALRTVIAFQHEINSSIKEIVFVLFNSQAFVAYSSVLHELIEKAKTKGD